MVMLLWILFWFLCKRYDMAIIRRLAIEQMFQYSKLFVGNGGCTSNFITERRGETEAIGKRALKNDYDISMFRWSKRNILK